MGFETVENRLDVRNRLEFETSLWDLKLCPYHASLYEYGFETSLWDLKRSNFKEFIQKAVRLQRMQVDG